MSAVPSTNETQELRRLIPLNSLPAHHFEQLCSELKPQSAAQGYVLFHQGDSTNEFVYVLSGTVSLQAGGVEMDSVTGGSDVSRFALAHQNPRKVSAVATTPIRYVRIHPGLVSAREDPQAPAMGYEVSDSDDTPAGDWMSALVRSPVFQRLPPANLQALLRSISEVEVEAGQVICNQGDPGDFFYIIKNGRCSLTRKPSPNAKEIRLATLKACDTFGEDALISEQPRTLTVTMETKGRLLRLDKASFLKLVRDPVITRLSAKDAIAMVHQGGTWLDVRLPDQYQQRHPRGDSLNAPFFSLRMMLSTLDRKKKYVCVCEDGKLSDAAAYLLLRHRFNAHVLQGGLSSLPADEVVGDSARSAPAATQGKAGTDGQEPAKAVDYAAMAEWQQAEAPSGGQASGELEARLNRLLAAKDESDAELQRVRQTVHHLETTLHSLRQEHQALLSDRARDSESAVPAAPVVDEGSLQELEDLRSRCAELELAKQSAGLEIARLEQEVGDLKAMVQEFLEQGELPADEEVEALRTELQMVREHAGSELATLQGLLGEKDAENARLRTELQSVKTKMSVRAAADSLVSETPAGDQRTGPFKFLWPLLTGILLTALTLGALFGSAPGRDLVRTWVGQGPG